MTYQEKLKDPRWLALRSKIIERSRGKCECCGRSDKPLQIHHKIYLKGREPWEYDESHLECLCEDHHLERELVNSQLIEELKLVPSNKLLAQANELHQMICSL